MESSPSADRNGGNSRSHVVNGATNGTGRLDRDSLVPSFTTQANALMRKNVTFQKRSWKTNCCIISLPIIMFIILLAIQSAINAIFGGSKYKCGCQNGVCGIQYSDATQAAFCALPHPPEWAGVMQVPRPQYRAAVLEPGFGSSNPATVLWTGSSSAASTLASNLLISNAPASTTDSPTEFSILIPGSASWLDVANFYDPSFLNNETFYVLQNQSCNANDVEPSFTSSIFLQPYPAQCLSTQLIQRDSVATIDSEIYKGFRKGDPQRNPQEKINEYVNAYDFGNTDAKNFDVSVFWNQTMTNDTSQAPPGYARVSRPMNLAAQAFLRFLTGPQAELPLWFVKEMPKGSSKLTLDFSSILGPLFYAWIIQLLLPVILTYLVYEKQQNLRIMMKMHGLGDGAYWFISYFYFLALSLIYTFFYVFIGSVINLKFFRLNSYGLQFIFYFIYINLQIAMGFLGATIFSSVRTATVCGYLYVIGFGLLGNFFYQNFLEDVNTGRGWIFAMELIPGFSLFRGLYEFAQYAFTGAYEGTKGMKFSNLSDHNNGMTTVWAIQVVEWAIFLALAWYLDQVVSSSSGVKKHPLFLFKKCFSRRSNAAAPTKSLSKTGAEVSVEMEKQDVLQERETVEKLLEEDNLTTSAIVCDNLKKVYPGTDGNADKIAVRGFSLAVGKSECFGMLGPNGAGKTSTINMMIGFLTPTSGTAYIHGLDIRTDMDNIYTSMGVCPQHDLIWENLTGREHLLFYGRLKNLKGAALENAVTDSLKSVNLFNGGVWNKTAGQYSGGMKRRLSVAISLIGNPQVVYMDEPSTGLDPSSRYNLWNVVKQAKKDRAIILTTHSMEEAEALCDRLGIFVDGQLQCIGDSKELTARYGGVYVLTITTPAQEEVEVEYLVKSLSQNAKKVYGLSGTQKFEIPKSDVEIGQVFTAMQKAKQRLAIQAWGIADTTLEDVFVKVARDAQGEIALS
ncbi:unnamed protein product [Calypogeia fissa]